MIRREPADAELDALLGRTLGTSPKPRLSPDFAAQVMERVEREEPRGGAFGRAWVLQVAFGIGAVLGTGFIIAGIRWPAWLSIGLLASTPFVFLGLAFSRRVVPGIAALIEGRGRA